MIVSYFHHIQPLAKLSRLVDLSMFCVLNNVMILILFLPLVPSMSLKRPQHTLRSKDLTELFLFPTIPITSVVYRFKTI